MAKSQKIRAASKKVLEPFLADQGFQGKHPHFQRREGDTLHLLSVIYDKWGGGLVLEFARHAAGDLHTAWGEIVPEAKLEIGYCPADTRARLVASDSGQGRYEDFFRYEQFAEDREQCEQLMSRLLALFDQVDTWLREERVGKNISPFSC